MSERQDETRLRALENEIWDALSAPRTTQRRRSRDVAFRFDVTLGGVRIGKLSLRLSRVADFLVKHYEIDRDEATERTIALFRALCRGGVNEWLARLALDDYIRREVVTNPARLLEELGKPFGAELLGLPAVQQFLWLQADRRTVVDAIAAKFAGGLRSRRHYQERRNKGGRPKKPVDGRQLRAAQQLADDVQLAARRAKRSRSLPKRREALRRDVVDRFVPHQADAVRARIVEQFMELPPAEIGRRVAGLATGVARRLLR
jgi:hypothetical protein